MGEWERHLPLAQKFTKTDLAKFESTWDEEPHFVSRGPEKNFTEWTLAREDEGWPVADETFFRRLVAKAILFNSISALRTDCQRAGISRVSPPDCHLHDRLAGTS